MKSGTPILLCLVPGYDASGRVDDLSVMTCVTLGLIR